MHTNDTTGRASFTDANRGLPKLSSRYWQRSTPAAFAREITGKVICRELMGPFLGDFGARDDRRLGSEQRVKEEKVGSHL
jgi:hypothetical protein